MPLVDSLRSLLGRPAASFQLMGEDLALVPGAALSVAADRYTRQLAAVPADARAAFEAEQAAVLQEAHRWLVRYNRSIHTRVAGYLELGRRCDFIYPWPVVAILGICQVMKGLVQTHLYGLVGSLVGRARLRQIEWFAEGADDVLRRTNRGIFADSVPTVLYAIRCDELRAAGRARLAGALLDGPLPLVMDEEGRAIARALYAALAITDPVSRLNDTAQLTRRHFAREQAIFTHHIGDSSGREPGLFARLGRVRALPAPIVDRTKGRPRIVFRPFRLPAGFDFRDHERRVVELERAFIHDVTRDLPSYRSAVEYVLHRFGRRDERIPTWLA